jgi:hypothetical protein
MNERMEQVLRRSAEVLASGDEVIARERPQPSVSEWRLPNPAAPRARSFEEERLEERSRLASLERRVRDFEQMQSSRFDGVSAAMDGLADEAGAECGRLKKELAELRKQVEGLWAELALVKAQAKATRPHQRASKNKSPFHSGDDDSLSLRN